MDSFQDMEDEDANSSLDAPGFEDISHQQTLVWSQWLCLTGKQIDADAELCAGGHVAPHACNEMQVIVFVVLQAFYEMKWKLID